MTVATALDLLGNALWMWWCTQESRHVVHSRQRRRNGLLLPSASESYGLPVAALTLFMGSALIANVTGDHDQTHGALFDVAMVGAFTGLVWVIRRGGVLIVRRIISRARLQP